MRSFVSALTVSALCMSMAIGAAGCATGNQEQAGTSSSASGKEALGVSQVSDRSVSVSTASPTEEEGEDASLNVAQEDTSSSSSVASQVSDRVSADIQALADSSGMNVCIAAIDLTTGDYAGCRGSESMVSASMIKLIIAHTFLEQVRNGAYSLQDSYVLQSSDIVGGTGTLAGLGAGAAVTYSELLDKMISVSDNTATNVLIGACGGMDAVNADARSLGLEVTQLNRYMMDADAMAAGVENYTSADDLSILLKMVWDGAFVDEESSALILAALEGQQDVGGILKGLPAGVSFAHKTGSLSTVRHDGGIVEGDHPYVLVVLCGGEGFYEQGALDVMAQIGATTYSGFAG